MDVTENQKKASHYVKQMNSSSNRNTRNDPTSVGSSYCTYIGMYPFQMKRDQRKKSLKELSIAQ